MITMRTMATAAVAGIRRRPGRALAACAALATVSVFAGTTAASAHPAPALAVPRAALHAAPAPLVDNFDTNLTGAHVKAYKHAYAVPVPWNVDGCDHDYGQADQCVPWQIPASTPQAACAWLKSDGFGPLKVYGTNRQHLPENAQGYVCAGTSSLSAVRNGGGWVAEALSPRSATRLVGQPPSAAGSGGTRGIRVT